MVGASPISLYFHIPLCKRKCPYCHFYVTQDRPSAHSGLVEALHLEIEQIRSHLVGNEVVSVYFGGGTPFLLNPEEVAGLINAVPRADVCEITIEANPEDVTCPKVRAFSEAGVNRLSLGVQSLDNALLKRLGRGHTAQRALEALDEVRQGGVENVSIDLMFDIPGQDFKSWDATLLQVEMLPITHLSLYNLTIEPKTAFARQREALLPLIPSDEEGVKMWEHAVEAFEGMGLERYEISAFAKPGCHSRHNLGYWTGRPFWGLGPSAFSYWKGRRFRNVPSLKQYCAALKKGTSPVDFEEKLNFPDDLHELLAIGLRQVLGVDLGGFQRSFGGLPDSTKERLESLRNEGFLFRDGDRIALTKQGLLFYDTVAERLI